MVLEVNLKCHDSSLTPAVPRAKNDHSKSYTVAPQKTRGDLTFIEYVYFDGRGIWNHLNST